MARFLSHFTITLVAYYVAGKFGLLLAIPPGFASAVWPASGVALTCYIMLRRWPVVLGVILGSFLVNFPITADIFTHFEAKPFWLALGIGVGAGIQTSLGGYLFQRYIGLNFHLGNPKDIIRFTLLVAPLGCLASSLNGTSWLLLLNFIDAESLVFSWFTWWIGDSLGVVVFTPLLLTVLSNTEHMSKARKLQLVLPSMIIFFSVFILFTNSLNARKQDLADALQESATQYLLRIQEHISISSSKLRAYEAFFQASNEVSLAEFDQFSSTLIREDNSFQAVGWTEVVDAQDRAFYEQKIQQAGYPDFKFVEPSATSGLQVAANRERYYPVLYIYPYANNKAAHGLNLGANSSRLESLENAYAWRTAVATAPITLVQDVGNKVGVILYLPVFKQDSFVGYISGVFVINDIVRDVIEDSQLQGYVFSIRDITQPDNPIDILKSDQKLANYSPSIQQLSFGKRSYEVTIAISDSLVRAIKDWNSWAVLTSGFLVAGLLNAFIMMLTGTTENIRKEVALKTIDLETAKQIAENANRAKSNFLANMSHEIRTPLNAIMGLLDICLKTDLATSQRNYLVKSKMASQTLLALINQILDYAKIESGKLELEHISFNMVELLEKIHAIFATQATERQLSFELKIDGELPVELLGDPLRIEQILLNLCSNALKFTEKGEIVVSVKAVSIDPKRTRLNFSIADTGVGIAEQSQAFLFESFRQADTTTTRKYGGTGLGLTISKELTELMGGAIKLDSKLGQGTTFTVEIPLQLLPSTAFINANDMAAKLQLVSQLGEPPTHHPNEPIEEISLTTPKAPDSTEPQASGTLDGLKILIVEDNDINQLVAKELFSSEGAQITIAPSGQFALNILKRDARFDLVLLDIQMPEMDGYEVAGQIRQFEGSVRELPIIAMTANVSESDKQQCLEAGMNGHIGKPLNLSEATQQILTVLKRRS